VNSVAPPLAIHKPRFAQDSQVLRDGGMGDAEPLRESSDTQAAVGKLRQYLHARWVGQCLEHPDQVICGHVCKSLRKG
jgi:hypothetical protein